MTAPSLAPVTTAFLEQIRAATGRPIGDLAAPPAADVPYGFLAKIDTRWSGSLRNAHEVAQIVYQLTCVGVTTEQVEWLEHAARVALATPPAVTGWVLSHFRTPDQPGGIRIDQDVNPPLAYSTPQWRLWAQPTV